MRSVGNAGTSPRTGPGTRLYQEAGKIDALPRMIGFQAKGAAPIVRGYPIESLRPLQQPSASGTPLRGQRLKQPGTSPAA